jgi:hypothetical protein
MVRRILGFVAFVVGCVLLFLSPLMAFYVKPRVEKAPTDIDSTDFSNGSGKIFVPTELHVIGPVPLQNISVSRGDQSKSTDTVVVIDRSGTTVNLDSSKTIDYSFQIYAMDRSTGEAVDCCGAAPPAEGYTLKLPFDTQKIDYSFYNDTLGKAFPAKYQREEEVAGLNTYVFTQEIPKTFYQAFPFPGSLAGVPDSPSVTTIRYYEATTTIWVEPLTGAIINGSQQAHQWLEYGGKFVTDLADTDLTNTPETIAKNAEEVHDKMFELRLVEALPLWGLIIGGVLVVVGLFLILGARDRSEPSETATG